METLFRTPLFQILVIALVGAFIGWSTNLIAIRLLFRPINPVKVPVLGITLQGIIPRRKKDLARSIAEIIDKELLSLEEMLRMYSENKSLVEIKMSIINGIMHVAGRKIPAFIYTAFESPLENYLHNFFNNEGDELLRSLVEKYIHEASSRVSLTSIVEEKINGFDMSHLEEIILKIAGKELKHIELLGAVLGFFIGIVQGLLGLIF